ncbi:hypothetical protein SSX86_020068 [Deinandra increscens subsp. villosa]|uniref:DUF4220 domain-containing protein n=1 Tax=Deinandra increscens subsp. villosa TaxID=3103831 RepID=A0AAP0GTM7_9ASTR
MVQMVSADIQKLWNEHGLQALILVSLVLQIILHVLGNLRKHNPRTLIRTATLWSVYNLAYAVVPAALTISAQSTSDVSARELMSFWASLFLLDLGGPDNFTAYSSEDNELWLRHLMFMVTQSVLALYVILLSFPGRSHLPLLSVVIYAIGVIKCFGRVQALRFGSSEHLRGSLLGPADPGPDYAKFMEEFRLKKSQGFIVKVDELADHIRQVVNVDPESGSKEILESYRLFKIFEPLFVDLILTYEERDISTSYFKRLDSCQAFRAVEIELGFAYDKFYTKANVIYTYKGLLFHATSVFLSLFVLVGFYFISDISQYPVIDVYITYLVTASYVSKELFALVTMVRSDWTDLWLNQHNLTRNILKFECLKQPTKQRWSNAIAQLDLLSVALEEKPARALRIQVLFGVEEYLETQRYERYAEVSANLKDMIYSQFKQLMSSNCNKPSCIHKGGYSLHQNNCSKLLWSIHDVEFDRSILIWHIATSLCYYSDIDDQSGVNRIESNHMSKYLLNLLVSYPEMLPKGIGMIRYRDTCADAKRFFQNKGAGDNKVEAYINLLKVVDHCKEVLPSEVTGDRSKTALFDGVRLAKDLMEMSSSEHMWKVVSQVWIEILGHAAANCRAVHHSQQLGRGGQLLTHVWLLMANLGLTEHFQVSQGHARAKLNVS